MSIFIFRHGFHEFIRMNSVPENMRVLIPTHPHIQLFLFKQLELLLLQFKTNQQPIELSSQLINGRSRSIQFSGNTGNGLYN